MTNINQENGVPPKGHPLIFTIVFMMGIFFIALMFISGGDILSAVTKEPEYYFEIKEADFSTSLLSYSYDVSIDVKHDMDSLTLYLDCKDEKGVIVDQLSKTLYNLESGSEYVFSFDIPITLDIERVECDPADAKIE